MASFQHIVQDNSPDAYGGGYKNVFLFAPVGDFTALKKPEPGETPQIGDKLKITTAHTFASPKGFHSWDCKLHSVTLKSATQGEAGAKTLMHTAEFIVLGDSASTQEQMQAQLNSHNICLLKDAAQCGVDEYIQLGNDCVPVDFTVEFDGKTTAEGKKEYKVTAACSKKYFYNATVTKAGA